MDNKLTKGKKFLKAYRGMFDIPMSTAVLIVVTFLAIVVDKFLVDTKIFGPFYLFCEVLRLMGCGLLSVVGILNVLAWIIKRCSVQKKRRRKAEKPTI
jgi:uncharacterized membrane protein YiaA